MTWHYTARIQKGAQQLCLPSYKPSTVYWTFEASGRKNVIFFSRCKYWNSDSENINASFFLKGNLEILLISQDTTNSYILLYICK